MDMKSELISVIIPVFNVEKYLKKCITSVMSQTYQNLEILLIDDGSPDHSGVLCDEYALKDRRIHVIHKTNGGLSDARNVGIDHSKGEFLVFIDSDDYIHPTMIERLYSALKENDAEISLCNWSYVDENYQSIEADNLLSPVKDEVLSGKHAIQKLFENNYIYYVVAWNKLYKRELFDQVRFIYGRVNEDEFIVHRLFGQCRKIACVQTALYFYYQRTDSIMGKIKQNPSSDHYLNIVDILLDRMQYLQDIHMDTYAVEAYRRGIWKFYKAFDFKNENSLPVQARKKRIKKEIRKNFRITKSLSVKQRMPIFMVCIDPKVYTMYNRMKNILHS